MPGAEDVDVDYVVTHFGPDISSADIREVVRRTVLAGDGTVSTTELSPR